MPDVRCMCAIGRRGQLGLNGRLPWEGNKGREFVADVARFFDMTRGHVIMAGPRTAASIPAFARHDRTIVEIRSHDRPEDMLARFPERVVFIGGGPPVWDVYAPVHPALGHHRAPLRRRCRPLVRSRMDRRREGVRQ